VFSPALFIYSAPKRIGDLEFDCNQTSMSHLECMLELEEALSRIVGFIRPGATETVPLSQALDRFLAEPVRTPIDLPSFDNSAMDGYAVRAEDVVSAKPDAPVLLRLVGRVAAGEVLSARVEKGCCVRLFTGSALPAGADAVVMQEDTKVAPNEPDKVFILDAAKPWENIRLRGEDIRAGAVLVEKGERLTSGRISLLAACGIGGMRVGAQPRVALLATGSELSEAGCELSAGHIYESNRIGLAALCRRAGTVPEVFSLVPDSLEATRSALTDAFSKCDAVVSSGGVSVGEFDFLKQAFADNGGDLQFWKVAIKPGRPFVFGRWGEKFLFGLPGNPVSALVTFLLLVRPALLRWQGASDTSLPSQPGALSEAFRNPDKRRHFMRVKIDGDGNVTSAGTQASHMLGSLAASNGLVDVPPQTSLPAGTTVRVLRWD
jgi:molybdopterin molybdotransferase